MVVRAIILRNLMLNYYLMTLLRCASGSFRIFREGNSGGCRRILFTSFFGTIDTGEARESLKIC